MAISAPSGRVRIVVVDDFEPFRKALFQLFSEFKGIEVVGEAADGNSAIETTLHLLPEVVIMDVKMPRLNGVEATRRIKRAIPDIHVVGISSQDDRATRESMTNAGCAAFVIKECAHTLPEVIAKLTGRVIAKNAELPFPTPRSSLDF
jgi:two-component system, NarL family, invasion response regulator UvrY